MSALIRAALSAESVKLNPGETAELTLVVQNHSEIVNRYKITVAGIDPAWVSLSRGELSLFPQDEDAVRLLLTLPESSAARAGVYEVSIQVASAENAVERTTVQLQLEIAAAVVFEAAIRPQVQSGLTEGVFTLQLSNQGNDDLTVQLSASDPEEGCLYTFQPPQVRLPAGQERLAQLTVRPKVAHPPDTKTFAFTVTARPAEMPKLARQVQGQWQQLVPERRRIWPILLAALLGLVAVAAVLIMLLKPGFLGFPGQGAPTSEVAVLTSPTAVPTGKPTTPAPSTAAPPPSATPPPSHTPLATRTPTIGIVAPTLLIVHPILTLPPVYRPTANVAYNLLPLAEDARWINDQNSELTFGVEDNAAGFASYRNDATLEDGERYSQVLVTHPRWVDNGAIQGDFSTLPYIVGTHDEFYVLVGLISGAGSSDGVRFRVLIQPQGGRSETIVNIVETYDGRLTSTRVSLEEWAGQTVTFLLQVLANGNSTQDWATWAAIRVER
ncbi:MAG: hypothetical protein JW900_14945 [Anaerolineae bacterium]|nr:hypothetical protein [Anaerolineae bacterium]